MCLLNILKILFSSKQSQNSPSTETQNDCYEPHNFEEEELEEDDYYFEDGE